MHFGPFRLDVASQCLWRGPQAIALAPKSFEVLRYLLEHPGQLVSKEALLDAVWRRAYVSDAVLKMCIREIRKALEDDPKVPRYIETRHRLGYRFIGAIAPAGLPAVLPPAFAPTRLVGRETALAQLQNHLKRALEGERQVVFVTGEPGIGKSTLIKTFCEQAVSGDWCLAQGQCLEHYGGGEPYLPVLEAIGRLCQAPQCRRLIELLHRFAPTWLAQMPALVSAAERERLKQAILGATRERMLREMAEALEAFTSERPLALLLEDLHWSDHATLDLVSALARRQEKARLLLIGTYRPADAQLSQHPLQAVKQELQIHRHCAELALDFLTSAAVADYLSARFPQNQLPKELAWLIWRRTEGNPLFMVNVVDHLIEQGLLAAVDGQWRLMSPLEAIELKMPQDLKQMIEQQLGRLSEEEQQILEAASAVGLEFSTAELAGALGKDLVQLEACCERLARRGQFLCAGGLAEFPDGAVAERYGFIHAFHQNTCYQRIPITRRVRLHRRIGACNEALYGERAKAHAAELALHFEEGKDYGRALRYLSQAADNAARRFANREAVAHLAHALALIERLPKAQQADAQLAAREQLGLVRCAMGDVAGALEDFDLLAAHAQAQGRVDCQVKALFARAINLAWVDIERCLATAEQAVELSGQLADPLLQAHARGFYGYWHSLYKEWRDDDARACAKAIEAARRTDDLPLLTLHTGRYAYFQYLRSDYEAAYRSLEGAQRLALEIGDAFEYMLDQFYRALILLHRGQWGEMWRLLEEGIAMAEKNGHLFWAALYRLEMAWLSIHCFDFASAQAWCEEGLEQTRQLHYETGQRLSLILLGYVYLGLERYGQALDCFMEASYHRQQRRPWLDWPLQMPLHLGLSSYHLTQGAFEPARQEAERLCRLAAQPGERTYLALGRQRLAEIHLAEARGDQAEKALAQALSVLQGGEAPLAAWGVYGSAAQFYERCGRPTEADLYWAQSAAVLNQLADALREVPPLRRAFLAQPQVQAILQRAASSD